MSDNVTYIIISGISACMILVSVILALVFTGVIYIDGISPETTTTFKPTTSVDTTTSTTFKPIISVDTTTTTTFKPTTTTIDTDGITITFNGAEFDTCAI